MRAKDLHRLRAEQNAMHIAQYTVVAGAGVGALAVADAGVGAVAGAGLGYCAGILREAIARGYYARKILRKAFRRDITQGYLLKDITHIAQ